MHDINDTLDRLNQALAHIEPPAAAVPRDLIGQATLSIAISLKRIADSLARLEPTPMPMRRNDRPF